MLYAIYDPESLNSDNLICPECGQGMKEMTKAKLTTLRCGCGYSEIVAAEESLDDLPLETEAFRVYVTAAKDWFLVQPGELVGASLHRSGDDPWTYRVISFDPAEERFHVLGGKRFNARKVMADLDCGLLTVLTHWRANPVRLEF